MVLNYIASFGEYCNVLRGDYKFNPNDINYIQTGIKSLQLDNIRICSMLPYSIINLRLAYPQLNANLDKLPPFIKNFKFVALQTFNIFNISPFINNFDIKCYILKTNIKNVAYLFDILQQLQLIECSQQFKIHLKHINKNINYF